MRRFDSKLARVLPPLLLIALLIAVWWLVVARSDSPIFPTPGQVATGAWALAQDGTLWDHIEASLFRVEIGFGLAFVVAVPLGLWMGWVSGAYRTLNPLFQMLRPISPIAWIPVATCPGVGKIGLSLRATTIHHTAISVAMSSTGGKTRASLLSNVLTVPLFDPALPYAFPVRLRQRQRNLSQPGAGRGSTITLSDPSAWAVHRKL